MNTASLETQLRRTIRRGRVLSAPAQLAGYDTDGLGYKTFRPDAVVIPADADEMVALLRASRELDVPVTIRGAGTSLAGGPVAAQGGIVVHTSSLKKVRTICREGLWCEVECSVTLNQLDEALRPHNLFYPPDPSSGPVCTLGGNVAMNAGGAHCFRYGVTSNYVLGLEVVMLDGSVQRFGGPGGGRGNWHEDWKRLMVGSEGTLGAFTRFWLRLLPRPEKAWTFRATFPDLHSAEKAVHGLVVHPSFPVAIELMDPRFVAMVENSPMAVGLPTDAFLLVTEIEGPAVLVDARVQSVADLMKNAGAMEVNFSDDENQRKKLWKARKVAGGLMGQLSPDMIVQDAVIPKSALAELLQLVYDEADAIGIPAINVFHAGDGNLHPNFLFDSAKPGELERVEAISKRLMKRVVDVGGTLSGEHGIGNDKARYMPLLFGPESLRMQLAVPATFNPRHQLNPLKVFGGRLFVNTQGVSPTAVSTEKHPTEPHHTEPAKNYAGASDITGPRLFVPFLDTIDGVTCVSADTTAAELEAQIASHRLRFPLITDAGASLSRQVLASDFAPASSRFGEFCDNIVGMNWRMPDGRVVRIGERVVKSTTGYDLLRFLLHSDGRFGQPVDFVLRLRPHCGIDGVMTLSGSRSDVKNAMTELLQSCWMNWFDSVDVVAEGSAVAETISIRIAINTPEAEWGVFESMVSSFAAARGLKYAGNPKQPAPVDGLPDFALKTTPDRVVELACELSQTYHMKCLALCYNGVVHGYLPQTPDASQQVAAEQVQDVISRYSASLHEIGGEWRSHHLPLPVPQGVEARWLDVLTSEFSIP
jgi:glycolate oxidase subunit GlcD